MKKEDIFNLEAAAKRIIVDGLMNFVREHGSDITEREREDFGLHDECGYHVTKIFNFYDRDGCNVVAACYPIREPDDDENPLSTILDTFVHMSINCLYIERDSEGAETLSYYGWYNDGVCYNADFAESEHGEVSNFGLSELQNILDTVRRYCDF